MAADPVDRVWELMEKIGTCMLITRKGDDMHCRPMDAKVRRDEDAVYFLTDIAREQDNEIQANPRVALTFADPAGHRFVALTGHGEVSDDRDKIHELSTAPPNAWWENPDDPQIRVLRITPDEAEYWDMPGTIATYVTMVAAAVTGTRPRVSENRKVAM